MTVITRERSYDLAQYTSTWNDSLNVWTQPARHSNSKVGQWVEQRSTTPDDVPAYRLLIARNQSATTALTGTRYEGRYFSNPNGRIEYTGHRISNGEQVEGVRIFGNLTPLTALTTPGFGGSPDFSKVSVRALAGFAKKCFAAQNVLQGVVCFGELGETVRGIRGPLKALYTGLFAYMKAAERAARKAKRRASGRVIRNETTRRQAVQKALAGTWLEFMFGWSPLVHDIDSATRALSRIVTYRPPTEHVHYHAEDTIVGSPVKNTINYGAAVAIHSVIAREAEYHVKMYGTLINRSGWDGARQDLGFGWHSFVPSLWELIPYSFLVDYFTNIGDIINAAAINRALVAWINLGSKRIDLSSVCGVEATFQPSTSTFRRSGSISPGKYSTSLKVSVQRSAYSGSLVPPLAFEIPGLGMRWLNITALVAQGQATSRRIRL